MVLKNYSDSDEGLGFIRPMADPSRFPQWLIRFPRLVTGEDEKPHLSSDSDPRFHNNIIISRRPLL